jgi:hypothetical protein
MTILRFVALLAVVGCTASADAPAEPDASVSDAPEPSAGIAVPYDRAIQASSHNSFEREEPLLDQLVFDRIRSLELDIHSRKEGVDAPAGSWFVFHEDLPLNRNTSCTTLADCLRLLAAFHAAVPAHEVITVWLDLKAPFVAGHDIEQLDAAVSAALGRENIVTPADLLARCPGAHDVREAVTGACTFPMLGELRGKFIIGVTGGTLCSTTDLVTVYGGTAPRDRLAFVAPGITDSCPVAAYDAHRDIVMLNLVYEQHAQVAEVRERGLVARLYRGLFSLNNADDFFVAKQAGTNHIAMDMLNVDEDPWAATYSATGYPFECAQCGPPATEAGSLVALRAASGDVGGVEDNMFVAYDETTTDQTLSALVSVPSSHVEPDAKACLVARASTAPDAAGVALCRVFDKASPVFVVRTSTGAIATTLSASPVDGFSVETAAFLRLELAGNVAIASTSIDGADWIELGRATLPAPPSIRGIAVASKASSPVRAVFANLVGIATTHSAAIGPGASGDQLTTWR